MKLAVLCNHTVALPALQQLHTAGVQVDIGIDDANQSLLPLLQQHCSSTNRPLTTFRREQFESELHQWIETTQPKAVLLMTCPFVIPAPLLKKPKQGFINFHYGRLPFYRGANPVFEQLKRQEPCGGITIHQVDEGIDTGPVILQQEVPVHPAENFGMHMDKLSQVGAQMACTLAGLLQRETPLPVSPQNEEQARYYRRPGAADVSIRWHAMKAAAIIALINACTPWNKGAVMLFDRFSLGVSAAVVTGITVPPGTMPGTVLSVDPATGLCVATMDGLSLRLDIIYVNNEFMPGYRLGMMGIQPGMCFT